MACTPMKHRLCFGDGAALCSFQQPLPVSTHCSFSLTLSSLKASKCDVLFMGALCWEGHLPSSFLHVASERLRDIIAAAIAYSAPLLAGCQKPGHAAVPGRPVTRSPATAERMK